MTETHSYQTPAPAPANEPADVNGYAWMVGGAIFLVLLGILIAQGVTGRAVPRRMNKVRKK